MKNATRHAIRAVGGSALLLTVLTACPRPFPPPPLPEGQAILNFRFPATDRSATLTLAAIYFVTTADPEKVDVKVLTTGNLSSDGFPVYPGGPTASGTVNGGTLRLDAYLLSPLKTNPACLTPFKEGEARPFKEVVVTPETVKTCNVYFTLFDDRNRDGLPSATEEMFQTHDIYGYADAAFSYSFSSTDGTSVERGERTQGWSLVRHEVLQPSAKPGEYRVTMNSVPVADQGVTIRLHEATNPMTSMGLGGRK